MSETQKLKGYNSYKNVDLKWLKVVPAHWQIRPNRAIWNERKTNNCVDEKLLSVTIKQGLIAHSDLIASTVKRDSSNQDKSRYKLVKQNDIVYNKMRMWQGAVGVSKYQGIVSPAYIVLEPIGAGNSKYYHYLFRTPVYIAESHRNSYGICDDQLSLRFEDFKRMFNIIPPKEEQDQIVRYLDSKLVKINIFIRNKKRLIELLKEQKQAVINQAVTKGLDPDAKMKPSSVEWLGDLPEGWEVRPLKRVTSINKLSLSNSVDSNKIINYIDISTVGFTELKQEPVSYKFSEAPSRARRIVCHGDTIISTVRTYLKSIFYIDESFDGFIASTGFAVLTPSKLINKKLLNYSLSAEYFLNSVAKHSIGVSYPAISETVLARLKVVIPKNIDEQKEILNYVTKKIKTIDQTIDRIQKEIDLITEYRTSLISAVITGKVDVRGIEVDEPPAEELAELEPAELENEELQGDDLLESEVG